MLHYDFLVSVMTDAFEIMWISKHVFMYMHWGHVGHLVHVTWVFECITLSKKMVNTGLGMIMIWAGSPYYCLYSLLNLKSKFCMCVQTVDFPTGLPLSNLHKIAGHECIRGVGENIIWSTAVSDYWSCSDQQLSWILWMVHAKLETMQPNLRFTSMS